MARIDVPTALLRLAVSALQNALSEIMAQKKIVEGIIDAIRGDYIPKLETWQGEAADAFRAEVNNRVVPEIQELIAALLGIHSGIERGCTCVQDADKKCVTQVNNLGDTYRSIVKW